MTKTANKPGKAKSNVLDKSLMVFATWSDVAPELLYVGTNHDAVRGFIAGIRFAIDHQHDDVMCEPTIVTGEEIDFEDPATWHYTPAED